MKPVYCTSFLKQGDKAQEWLQVELQWYRDHGYTVIDDMVFIKEDK